MILASKMSFKQDQRLLVTDKTDGKKYPVRVVEIDNKKERIRIHYVDWKKTYDEWISFDSDRIHEGDEESEEEESFCDSQEGGSVGAAIGRLLLSIDLKSRELVSKYDIRLTFRDNCKNFSKFKVQELESCASALKIKTREGDGKKVFNKKDGLVDEVVRKIRSHLPQTCRICSEEYAVQLGDTVAYECKTCGMPSHCCKEIEKVLSVFPRGLPTGFVWLCGLCTETEIDKAQDKQEDEEIQPEEVGDDPEKSIVVIKTSTSEGIVNDNTKSEKADKKLCKHYVYKSCKYGAKGDGCQFAHPKKCFKFTREGTHKKRGCTEGKNCKFFHPPLCRSALRNGTCDKHECGFHHIKGTKFISHEDELVNPIPTGTYKSVAMPQPAYKERMANKNTAKRRSYANVVSSGSPQQGTYMVPNKVEPAVECQASNAQTLVNFLELRDQIQQMELRMETMMKTVLSQKLQHQTGMKTCCCPAVHH